jgi:ketosteroid isomerase-like protein
VDRGRALALLARLHEAQGSFYAGGSDAPLRAVLADDVVWHVPGANAIAGVYEGVEAVLAYMRGRRELAARTFRMHPGDVMVGDDHVAVLTDGTAVIDGAERSWSTVGLYRFTGDLVAECWLLPLDPDAFDAVWGTAAG